MGEMDAATESLERARDIAALSQGTEHPAYAQVLQSLASHRGTIGDSDIAIELHEEALRVFEGVHGPKHPRTISAVTNYAKALLIAGRLEAARGAALRAVEGTAAEGMPLGLRVGTRWTLGRVESGLEHYAEALAAHEEALAIARSVYPEGHVDVATHRRWVGRALVRLGRLDEARPHFEAALLMARTEFGDGHYELVPELLELGDLAVRRKEWRRAEALATEALDIMEVRGQPPGELARSRFLLARAIGESNGRRTRARALAEQAIQGYLDGGESQAPSTNQIQRWLETHPDAG